MASHSETDKELAQKLGTSPSTLGNWKEPKKKTPNLTELVFAYALEHNLDLNWLILGKESPTLGEMETELLARVAKLDFKQKLKLLNSLDNGDFAKNSKNSTASVNQTISNSTAGNIAGGNIQQGARFYFEDDE
ncbi:helix-turn-helix domain-containing protein [Mannheimia pernigra]|nr:helix-turn-helix domain-containing protein [Mannheimia pernigra]